MSRRCLMAGALGLILLGMSGLTPARAQAQTLANQTSANQAPTYLQAATWLFGLYAQQSVRLSITNALRMRPPGTDQVLAPQEPVMVTALARHRDAFVAAMVRPLQSQFSTVEIAGLLQQAKTHERAFDDATRQKLVDVDAEFRRKSQTVIRAMTTDIGLMIATSLSEQRARAP